MKRELKFRGKRIDNNGEWVYGDLLFYRDIVHEVNNTFKAETVDTETVGQYTGLKDKNGKEIFEGDIIVNKKATEPENTGFIVVWKDYGFKFKSNFHINGEIQYFDPFYTSEFEIIGNIYENPELLQ